MEVQNDCYAELLSKHNAEMTHKFNNNALFVEMLPHDMCVWETGTMLHMILTNTLKKCNLEMDGVS